MNFPTMSVFLDNHPFFSYFYTVLQIAGISVRILLMIVLCALGGGILLQDSGYAQSLSQPPPTNVEQLQKIVKTTVEHVVQSAGLQPGMRIRVRSMNDENSWLVDQSIQDVLYAHGIKVVMGGSVDSSTTEGKIDFFPVALGVRYSPAFRDGIFGKVFAPRIVEGKFSTSVVWNNGTVHYAQTYTEAITDTIVVSDIASIEHPTYRAARGESPASGVFDSLIEPFVIICTLAVAVYLLFTVRS
jgi:hypothetical protein